MWEDISKYLIVFGLSMLKFLLGMAAGTGFKLPFFVNATIAVLGMMTSVVLFTSFLGKHFHRWTMNTFFKDQKLFTKGNRRKIIIWHKFGLLGVAFLTPVLFSPIGGAIIANAFGETKERIFIYMLGSAILWALSFSYVVSLAKYYLPFLS
jgi:hypothetical protein